jgi:putative membrane protein insertion efficiency factor
VKRMLIALLVLPIRVYRRWVSPAFAPRCRYYPTCSHYAEQAIRELGPIRGSILAGYRLLRCNPFSAGGVDELSDRRLFRGTRTRSERAPSRAVPPAGGTGGSNLT